MGLGLMDIVESGDYKGGEIKLKGLCNKPTLIIKGIHGKSCTVLIQDLVHNAIIKALG